MTALLDHARRVQWPTAFLPGLPSREPEEFTSLDTLAAWLAQLAAGRPLTFRVGRAAYPEFEGHDRHKDSFLSVTAYAGGDYLCTFADRWRDAEDRAAALRVLEASGLRAAA